VEIDLNQTLLDIERDKWSDPTIVWTPLTQRIRDLARIPLREFTAEDLRLLIGQERALDTLLPLALDELKKEPFAEGDMYVGDLLMTVVREVKAPHAELKRIVATAIARLDELDDVDREALEPQLREAYERL
jgi:CDI immunity proteins